jgi:hypothetical protein
MCGRRFWGGSAIIKFALVSSQRSVHMAEASLDTVMWYYSHQTLSREDTEMSGIMLRWQPMR